jgi:sulfite reductase beta subunit-like hemoprotein
MDLSQLRYVLEVADASSFTRAAERCFVTQSALSHQIAALERELGQRLFVRSSRSVRMSPTRCSHSGLRRLLSACIGSDGCASGQIAARTVAADLSHALAANTSLHVSGCTKGCAHPGPADITLVGRADGYGLVISGRAGDTPRALLRADQLESAVAAGQG